MSAILITLALVFVLVLAIVHGWWLVVAYLCILFLIALKPSRQHE